MDTANCNCCREPLNGTYFMSEALPAILCKACCDTLNSMLRTDRIPRSVEELRAWSGRACAHCGKMVESVLDGDCCFACYERIRPRFTFADPPREAMSVDKCARCELPGLFPVRQPRLGQPGTYCRLCSDVIDEQERYIGVPLVAMLEETPDSGPTVTEAIAIAEQGRRPRPPEELVDALQDRVHVEGGLIASSRPPVARYGPCSQALMETPASLPPDSAAAAWERAKQAAKVPLTTESVGRVLGPVPGSILRVNEDIRVLYENARTDLETTRDERDSARRELSGARDKICDLLTKLEARPESCPRCRKCPRCRLAEILKNGADPALVAHARLLIDACDRVYLTHPQAISWGHDGVRMGWDSIDIHFAPGKVSIRDATSTRLLGPMWLGDALGAVEQAEKPSPHHGANRGLSAHVATGPACAMTGRP